MMVKRRKKKLAIRVIIAAALIAAAFASEKAIESYMDVYKSELSSMQMETEKSEMYMAYSKTVRVLETMRGCVWVPVFLYGGSVILWKCYKVISEKEKMK